MEKKYFFTLGFLFIFIFFFIILNKYVYPEDIEKFKMTNKKIPLILFKTGSLNVLPSEIQVAIDKCSKKLQSKYYYFNDQMCHIFIKNNYDSKVLTAYDSLIPTAYKADLWRFCILYKFGGIYSDLSQEILNSYNINRDDCDLLLVRDRPICYSYDNIQISFMATIPKNNFFKYVIDNLTNDILNRRKGVCSLDVTGPVYIGRLFKQYFNLKQISNGIQQLYGLNNEKYKVNIFSYMYNDHYIKLLNGKNFIKAKTKNHYKLLYGNNKLPHYSLAWKKNLIFNKSNIYNQLLDSKDINF